MATLNEKGRLLRGLLTGETAEVGPFYALVDVTRSCNLACLGCRYHSPHVKIPSPGDRSKTNISFRLFEELCNQLGAMGTERLILTGEGEPFLHPRLLEMISAAKKVGLHVTLFTNGTLLDETKVQSLIDAQLDVLTVSLWAGSKAEYERNHPGAGPEYFNTIVDALRHLARLKGAQASHLPSAVIHHPIYRNNFDSIQTIAELAQKTGCNTLSFSPLRTRRGKLGSFALTSDETKSLSLNLAGIKRQLDSLSIGHNIDNTILRYRAGEKVWEKVPCYVGWVQVHVKVDGTVLPCNSCSLPMGNLNEHSLSHIWNGPPLKRFRRQTLTKEGLAHMGLHCDCHFCCHVEDNMRVHRIFRWFSPFLPGKKNRKAWLTVETS